MSPKKLLRLPEARSSFDDMLEGIQWLHHVVKCSCYVGTRFQRLIPDSSTVQSNGVQKLLFCSGKIYYELVKQRAARGLDNEVAITRIEQVL